MSTTPASKIEGPIPATTESHPFHGLATDPIPGPGLAPLPLARAGFAQEEYVVSGEAEGVPYRTSLLVRKPMDAKDFSGVVLVETVHAAGAVPLSALHIALGSHGHGYALVASQKVALDSHVKPSDPTRYASLDIPDRGESQEPVSNAILSQVGALLKADDPAGPFAGLPVEYLVMGGSSQTGGTTLRFIRDAHADARLPDGAAIYDGYFPTSAGGVEPVGRHDAAVIHTLNEGDIMGGRPLGYRRPDSDDPDDRYRLYEIVASSHVPTRGVESVTDIFPLLANASSPDDQLSQFPTAPLVHAALFNLIAWVTSGVAPPRAELIRTDPSGEIVRDDYGNALGGVRSSYVDVPFATFIASSTGEDMFRRMIGQQIPFSPEQLAALYPTHGDYVGKVKACVDALVQDRWVFPQDGAELVAEAEHAAIP